MNKTKIDWTERSWNPVTGCLHGCEYCYARKITTRFGTLENNSGDVPDSITEILTKEHGTIVELNERLEGEPYPYNFVPTFHKYRLEEPQKIKKPQTVFVCSMADLFGDWVPDEWISEVFKACEKAPQHRYLFLTKNPKRYSQLAANNKLPLKFWYGYTLTGKELPPEQIYSNWRTFVSIEPLLSMPDLNFMKLDNTLWVIIGAETGNRKEKVVPERKWIEKIIDSCRISNVPVFMKESLRGLMGQDFTQEFPW